MTFFFLFRNTGLSWRQKMSDQPANEVRRRQNENVSATTDHTTLACLVLQGRQH